MNQVAVKRGKALTARGGEVGSRCAELGQQNGQDGHRLSPHGEAAHHQAQR